MYGHELNESITPIEANLTWAIHKERLADINLNGRNVILNQIKKLEKENKSLEIQNKIKIYTLELKKIEDMFPKDFFEK